ncbi:MAG: hypothetical protein HQK50_09775 [Oligoflexia bacterium]|nr:hypothetical protein [Oligoflexia bacterium]MBF0365851.1 hypothetical protein [Oligoflexia bacterium]
MMESAFANLKNFSNFNTNPKKDPLLFFFAFAALFAWCISSLYYQKHSLPIPPVNTETFKSVVAQIISLKILLLVFFCLYRSMSQRVVIVFLGSLAILLFGKFFGFYSISEAFLKINISTISLVFGMSVISTIIAETKCFEFLGSKLILKFGNNHFALFLILCLISYVCAFMVNSLMAMLLIIPLTLRMSDALKLKSTPFLIGEIIASNLGGTSSMTGDFPNMLISTELNIPYLLFIKYLMPICLVNLGVMFLYFYNKVDFRETQAPHMPTSDISFANTKIKHSFTLMLSVLVLLSLIILFAFTTFDPGLLALIASFVLFIFCKMDKETIIKKIHYRDVVFFILLFVLIGGIQSSGLLKTALSGISFLAFGNPFIKCLLLMWFACLITMFFGAGSATTILIPMFISLNIESLSIEHFAIWALSLGICAGSCGTLGVATAGPIACTLSEKFHKNNSSCVLNLINYSKIGLPLMYFHLLISTIYVILLFLIQ